MPTKIPVFLRKLLKANPERLSIEPGASHWKLKVDGRLVCVLPHKLKYSGLAINTQRTLEREGLTIPKMLSNRYVPNTFVRV